MRAKQGFVLRNLVGELVLMPTGENIARFNGTVLMNELSAFIWEKMQQPVSREELLTAILQEYEVDEATAASDLDALLDRLYELDMIEKD